MPTFPQKTSSTTRGARCVCRDLHQNPRSPSAHQRTWMSLPGMCGRSTSSMWCPVTEGSTGALSVIQFDTVQGKFITTGVRKLNSLAVYICIGRPRVPCASAAICNKSRQILRNPLQNVFIQNKYLSPQATFHNNCLNIGEYSTIKKKQVLPVLKSASSNKGQTSKYEDYKQVSMKTISGHSEATATNRMYLSTSMLSGDGAQYMFNKTDVMHETQLYTI